MTTAKAIKRQEAKDELRRILPTGTETVYTILRHVSSSGMTRWLDLYVIKDDEPRRITYQVATALGETYDRNRDALKVTGCGMDMCWNTVYNLSSTLYSNPADQYDPDADAGAGYKLTHRHL